MPINASAAYAGTSTSRHLSTTTTAPTGTPSESGNSTVELHPTDDDDDEDNASVTSDAAHRNFDDAPSSPATHTATEDRYESAEQRARSLAEGTPNPEDEEYDEEGEDGEEGVEDDEVEEEDDDDGENTITGEVDEDDEEEDDGDGEDDEDDDDDDDDVSSPGTYSASEDEDDDPDKIDPSVAEEMDKFEATFKGFSRRFRLVNKIGEGTFSSVYKAEDLEYDRYDNSWDHRRHHSSSRRLTAGGERRRPKYVAVKKIYVTSSPARIQNELELLHDLSGCESVVPLITAFRCLDQVVAVLPYFKHVDFREYFRELNMDDIKCYFRNLFQALRHVHDHNIIHRDIKPTNFLYDFRRGRGVLVDFGLAEREGTDSQFCLCQQTTPNPTRPPTLTPSVGYPKHDSRPSRRANRAGTRGFRAPEVLFKCTSQTTKLDIWSAGVILLTILSRRFPFFNSSDDVDAMIEIATIFGKAKMKACAALHGCVFETSISTIGERGFTLEKIVLWATNRTATGSSRDGTGDQRLGGEEADAVKLLGGCFELDPAKRCSAQEALDSEFLRE